MLEEPLIWISLNSCGVLTSKNILLLIFSCKTDRRDKNRLILFRRLLIILCSTQFGTCPYFSKDLNRCLNDYFIMDIKRVLIIILIFFEWIAYYIEKKLFSKKNIQTS